MGSVPATHPPRTNYSSASTTQKQLAACGSGGQLRPMHLMPPDVGARVGVACAVSALSVLIQRAECRVVDQDGVSDGSSRLLPHGAVSRVWVDRRYVVGEVVADAVEQLR